MWLPQRGGRTLALVYIKAEGQDDTLIALETLYSRSRADDHRRSVEPFRHTTFLGLREDKDTRANTLTGEAYPALRRLVLRFSPCIGRNSLLLISIVGVGAIAVGLHAADDQDPKYTVRTLALPDHGRGNITIDYIAYDPKTGYVWVPAINIGSVYVVDSSNNSVREISGFATSEVEVGGRKRAQGPSGLSIGDGLVYIGDRADPSVFAVDERTLARKACGHIDSTPDGVVYVASTKGVSFSEIQIGKGRGP